MSHLQDDHPKVYQHVQDGLHVIRRSDCYWAGLSSDLVIEHAGADEKHEDKWWSHKGARHD